MTASGESIGGDLILIFDMADFWLTDWMRALRFEN
jgi:hypothetical protein